METAYDDTIARALRPDLRRSVDESHQGQAGTSTGVNIEPGSDDDGWIVPAPVTLGDGTTLQLYKDGEALHAAYEAVKAAKQRICLEVYIFASDDTGRAFADLLCRKAREGVRVYVVYDAFGSIGSDRSMFREMRRAGANVQVFHPIRPWDCKFSWRPANRDHRKLLIIDHDMGGLGGLNVGREYAGSWVVQSNAPNCDLWRDNAIGLRGPSVKHLITSFARTWNYVTHGGRIGRAEYLHNVEDGELGIFASVPTVNSQLRPMLHKLLHSARRSISMTMAYFAPDDPLIKELCDAARRGVRVRLMLPARCDVGILLVAARSFYETLMSAGVEVYERQSAVLHAKTMVIDGHTTVIGSTNLDYRSIEYNCELSAIIRNDQFGANMETLFDNDVRYSKRIALKEWRRRPWLDRVGQWAVSRARYLL